jgi:bifunctional non-homologous end joining protein LigD
MGKLAHVRSRQVDPAGRDAIDRDLCCCTLRGEVDPSRIGRQFGVRFFSARRDQTTGPHPVPWCALPEWTGTWTGTTFAVKLAMGREQRLSRRDVGTMPRQLPVSGQATKSRRTPRGGLPWVPPQLATLSAEAPKGNAWVHEIKYDGYRILAYVNGSAVRLLTRNEKDWTARFEAVARDFAQLGLRHAVVDGEVGVEMADGRTSFQALQNAIRDPSEGQLQFWAFDLLFLKGDDLRSKPLLERKRMLQDLLGPGVRGVLRYSDHVVGHGPGFLAQACRHGLEGIISKRAEAPYRRGRSADWLKVKCLREQEFVVGGYTEPEGSRQSLGALHVGAFDEDSGLLYCGKVGTGFTDATLRDLKQRLEPLVRKSSPFVESPRGAAARTTHWTEPEVVVQIRYTEITRDGRLRHPSFMGLREDKSPSDVRLELPLRSPGNSSGNTKAAGRRATVAAPDGEEPGGQGAAPLPAPAGVKKRGGSEVINGVRLTSPTRVLYKDSGVTKIELARYYETISAWIIPHIENRPLTLVRCPSGVEGNCFFQKHFDRSTVPEAVHLTEIEERDGPELYGVVREPAGLISLVQLSTLELHTSNARTDRLDRPDRFIIDLDPDPGVSHDQLVDAALHVRHLLEEIGLESFLKTTGGKGFHIVVPLVRRSGWDEVKSFSGAVASLLSRAAPDRYTTEMSKKKRRGRILLDYLRNTRGATAIEAYSARARPGATVAAPIHWDELGDGVMPDSFNVRNMPARMASLGADPWNDMGAVRQSLTAPMKRKVGL